MRKVLITILLSILIPSISFAQQYIFPVTTPEKTVSRDRIEITFEDFLVNGWHSSFEKVKESFPGGSLRIANKKTNSAATYHLKAHFTDLMLNAEIIIHKPPHNPKSLPVKSVYVKFTSKPEYEEKYENVAKYLKEKFPQGGPFLRGNNQIGYVIPNHKNCGDIVTEWGEKEIVSNGTFRLTIQCHK